MVCGKYSSEKTFSRLCGDFWSRGPCHVMDSLHVDRDMAPLILYVERSRLLHTTSSRAYTATILGNG
jgi:hypothetical protein